MFHREEKKYAPVVSTFEATPEKGSVSALLLRPKKALAMLVLGHGASVNMYHPGMESVAHRLADVGIATFRYHFPYMERGGGGRDALRVSLATVQSAITAGQAAAPDLPLFLGGRSFGGRMASLALADAPDERVKGLIFFAFPLHAMGKPGTERAEPLKDSQIPMLFLSGTRDKLAQADLLKKVCDGLGKQASLHWLDTADHGFNILKRTRNSNEDLYIEAARVVRSWCSEVVE
jgi:hypothetical protein